VPWSCFEGPVLLLCHIFPCAQQGQEGAFREKLLSINDNTSAQQGSMGITSLS